MIIFILQIVLGFESSVFAGGGGGYTGPNDPVNEVFLTCSVGSNKLSGGSYGGYLGATLKSIESKPWIKFVGGEDAANNLSLGVYRTSFVSDKKWDAETFKIYGKLPGAFSRSQPNAVEVVKQYSQLGATEDLFVYAKVVDGEGKVEVFFGQTARDAEGNYYTKLVAIFEADLSDCR